MPWVIIESAFLNNTQMANNAQMYADEMSKYNMSNTSIAGQLGNIQTESTINPGIWQNNVVGDLSAGFGLVQWTPATNYINWGESHGYDRTDPVGQCEWIATVTASAGQWIPTSSYPLSWDEFTKSNESPEYLARAFLYNFERPLDPGSTEAARASQARHWFDTIDWENTGGGCFESPRLSEDGIRGNPYWYDVNPFYLAGYGLPNCTCYAWGRRFEITSEEPDTSLGNADTWWQYAVSKGQRTGQTPKLGALITFHYTGSSAGDGGHVAVVEQYDESTGTIITSNSAYGGTYFYTQTLHAPDYSWGSWVVLDGFIYLDCEPAPPQPPAKKRKGMPLWMYLFP